VAKRALAFEMDIIAYDPFISEQVASKLGIKLIDSLDVLLKECDYLTIHVPANEKTKGLLVKEKIALMKPTARIVNCARGEVIDQEAVVEAVKSGELAGAAFDVYEQEPPENFDFALDNRILATPHLGASTEAAQIAVGTQAASQMIDALQHEYYRNALNITSVSQEEMEYLNPFCDLARKLGIITAALSKGRPRSLQLTCMGEIADRDISPVRNHGVTGVLQYMLGNSVNVVSAPHLAEERGLAITSSTKRTTETSFTNMIILKLETKSETIEVAGTVLEKTHPRVTKIGHYETELLPDGDILLLFGHDKPGTIGKIGDVLGADNVNIARMTFGRQKVGGEALLALNLDTACEGKTLEKIKKLDVVDNAIMISL
jgi:D-3-phosphoglycerate dehydrogenase